MVFGVCQWYFCGSGSEVIVSIELESSLLRHIKSRPVPSGLVQMVSEALHLPVAGGPSANGCGPRRWISRPSR